MSIFLLLYFCFFLYYLSICYIMFFPCLGFHLWYLIPGAFINVLTIQCLLNSSFKCSTSYKVALIKMKHKLLSAQERQLDQCIKLEVQGSFVCFFENFNFPFGWKKNCNIRTVSGTYWNKFWLKGFVDFVSFNFYFSYEVYHLELYIKPIFLYKQ